MGGTVALKEQWHSASKYGSFEKSITAIFRTAGFSFLPCSSFPESIFLVYAIQKEAFSATPAKVIFLVIVDALWMMVWSNASQLLNFDTPNCLRRNIS